MLYAVQHVLLLGARRRPIHPVQESSGVWGLEPGHARHLLERRRLKFWTTRPLTL